jgi:hypothetical protein
VVLGVAQHPERILSLLRLIALEERRGGVEQQQVDLQVEQVGDGEEHRLLHPGVHVGVDQQVHRPARLILVHPGQFVQRSPIPIAVLGLSVLLVLGSPLMAVRLGFPDAGSRPQTDTTRRAYDLVTEGFGPGFSGPLLLAADLGQQPDRSVLERLRAQGEATPGVAFVAPPIVGKNGVAIVQVFPETTPQAAATEDLIRKLRDEVIPGVVAGTDAQVRIGGVTAARSTSPSSTPNSCRCSSAPSWCCRSCCSWWSSAARWWR